MRHKVICIQPLHPEGMKILNSRDDLEIIVPDSPDPATWANFLPGAEAICVRLTKIPRAMMEAAPNLKIISRHGVGFDTIDVAAATERGVIVATVGLANAPSVVEHTIAMMYALAKRLHELDRAVREGDYQRGRSKLASMDVAGRTVLIIGLGRIGSRLGEGARTGWASSAWASIQRIRQRRSRPWAASRWPTSAPPCRAPTS